MLFGRSGRVHGSAIHPTYRYIYIYEYLEHRGADRDVSRPERWDDGKCGRKRWMVIAPFGPTLIVMLDKRALS